MPEQAQAGQRYYRLAIFPIPNKIKKALAASLETIKWWYWWLQSKIQGSISNKWLCTYATLSSYVNVNVRQS